MANQELLPLGPQASVASRISECCTKQLLATLVNATDAKAATDDVMRDGLLLAECRRSLPDIERLARKCGPEAVYEELQRALILFGPPDFGPGTRALTETWIDIYRAALGHLPREALAYAVSQHIAFGKPFFPKPSELNALAKKSAEEIWLVAWRAKKAVEHADKVAPVTETPEERARGLAMVRRLDNEGRQ